VFVNKKFEKRVTSAEIDTLLSILGYICTYSSHTPQWMDTKSREFVHSYIISNMARRLGTRLPEPSYSVVKEPGPIFLGANLEPLPS
jgi:hypothetical protein